MESVLTSITENQLPNVARNLLSLGDDRRVYAIYGPMGVGKTTFIKAFCAELGSTDVVTSPTFSLVNQYIYHLSSIYHFDFYRINQLQEAMDLGYEEYFYSGHYCFIEWPEKIESLLPEGTIRIYLEQEPASDMRSIRVIF